MVSTLGLDPAQVQEWGDESSRVPTVFTIVFAHVKSQREKNVAPNEHLGPGLIAGVNRQNPTVYNKHGATSRSCHEIRVHFEKCAVAEEALSPG